MRGIVDPDYERVLDRVLGSSGATMLCMERDAG